MQLDERLAKLESFITNLGAISPACAEALRSNWSSYDAKRKTVITAAGDTERYLYFVCEGIQRIYFAAPSGKEATLVFTYAPSFGGVINSFLLQQASAYAFEAITESHLLRTHYLQWQQFITRFPEMTSMATTLNYYVISGLLERMAELQCFTAEEKFRSLLKRSPHVLNLVPHRYLANYLGIDAATFSRLLSTVRIH